MEQFVFGIDIGGTSVKCGLFTSEGTLKDKWEIPTDRTDGGKNVPQDIANAINAKCAELNIAKEQVAGVGLGVPGPVKENGYVDHCPNLAWRDINVNEVMTKLTGVPSVQIHNGGLCHIDADMTSRVLADVDTSDTDLLILENIGNLVCPAEFDTGAHKNVTILSVPEGDDKPLKYPLMYQVSDVVLINKIDTINYFNFDFEKAKERILALNPNALIFPISGKTGEGLDAVCEWIHSEVKAIKG